MAFQRRPPNQQSDEPFWADEKIIRDIPKSAGAVIRVSVCTSHDGRTVLNLREWFSDWSGSLKPTKKGMILPVEMTKALIESLGEIE